MRYIILKIIKVLSCIFILLLLTIPISTLFENASENLRQSNDIRENEFNDNDVIESNQEELQIEQKEEKQEIVETQKEKEKSTTSNKSITNNNSQETNVIIKEETTSTTSANNNVEKYVETPKQETNNNVNQYIGVPNPNDFYYSFHHGKIEYHSMDSCLADVPNIAFKDTIDIINTWCIDVVDGQGTILGQYLYINCSSGNCDKYK